MDQKRTGHVVSRFSGGINLLFGDGEAFVPVQMHAIPLHPWAIEIPGEPLRFAEGTPVSVEGGELSIRNTHIPFSGAQIEDLSLPKFSAEEAAIARHNFPILLRFVEEARNTHPPDPFQPEIDKILCRWHDANNDEVLLDLIGLGTGSTPSGDDVLVGIIATMSLFEYMDDHAKETLAQLSTGIQEIARACTPLPSAQMLVAASTRVFPEPILALLKDLTFAGASEDELLEKADRVLQLGQHSGLAMLLGLKE